MAIPLVDAVFDALNTRHFYSLYRREFLKALLPANLDLADENNREIFDQINKLFPEWAIFEASPIEAKRQLAELITNIIAVRLKANLLAEKMGGQEADELAQDLIDGKITWVEVEELPEPIDIDPDEFEKAKADEAKRIKKAVQKKLLENVEQDANIVYQKHGTFTETYTGFRAGAKDAANIDPGTQTLTKQRNDITVSLENFTQLKGFTPATERLLDVIFQYAADAPLMPQDFSEEKKPDLIIPVSCYLDATGLKKNEDTIKAINADLQTTLAMRLTFTEKSLGGFKGYKYINVFEAANCRNNKIIIRFSSLFFDLLKACKAMPIDKRINLIDIIKHPNGRVIVKLLYRNKIINLGKRNADIIPLKSLLAFCAYSDADKNGRHYRRIIEKFYDDMENLVDMGILTEWTYAKKRGDPLSYEELETAEADFKTWQNLYIRYRFPYYPAIAKKTRKRAAPKKAENGKK